MFVVFSRDRAMQLDLLLQSLDRYCADPIVVIFKASTARYSDAYQQLREEWDLPWRPFWPEVHFQNDVNHALRGSDLTTFLCDDNIVYKPLAKIDVLFGEDNRFLTYSHRLGKNTVVQYPTGLDQEHPGCNYYEWEHEEGDFGYPGSIDGHTFRTSDVIRMLDGKEYPNPTALECALVEGCREIANERPYMAIGEHSSVVGVPVNRVSLQSNVRHGNDPRLTAEALNEGYLAGERLKLSAIDFTNVNGAHTELDLLPAPEAKYPLYKNRGRGKFSLP